MALPEDVRRRLDEQAELARKDFEANWKNWTVQDLGNWWRRWCHHSGTNHDRLGRILMDATNPLAKWTTKVDVSKLNRDSDA
jgi:hypothetical protein